MNTNGQAAGSPRLGLSLQAPTEIQAIEARAQSVLAIECEDHYPADLRSAVHAFERRHIATVLTRADGDKAQAARLLGIGLSSLYRKMLRLGLVKDYPPPRG